MTIRYLQLKSPRDDDEGWPKRLSVKTVHLQVNYPSSCRSYSFLLTVYSCLVTSPLPSGPLHGLRIVGLEHSVAGPLCTRLLADLGADVIKIERPGKGDFARTWDDHASGDGAQFWWLNRGKRSVALDLRNEEDRARFDELLSTADALVVNLTPGAVERLGLTSTELRTQHPALTVCRITGYGTSTSFKERKAYDMLVQAEAGYMSLTGTRDSPARVGVSVCDVSTGLYAALLLVAGVTSARETGVGHDLDVAMLDVAAEFAGPMLLSYLNAGVLYPRLGTQHHAIAPYGAFECADGGVIVLAVQQDEEWASFCRHVLGAAELANDQRFAHNLERLEHRDEIARRIEARFSELDMASAGALLAEANIAYATMNDIQGLAEHPALRERGMFDVDHTSAGADVHALRGLGARLFGVSHDRSRPPLLGEDTAAVIEELGAPTPTGDSLVEPHL